MELRRGEIVYQILRYGTEGRFDNQIRLVSNHAIELVDDPLLKNHDGEAVLKPQA